MEIVLVLLESELCVDGVEAKGCEVGAHISRDRVRWLPVELLKGRERGDGGVAGGGLSVC